MGLFDRLRTIGRGTSRPPRPIDVGRAMLTAVDAQMVTAADGRTLVANHVTVRLAATDIDTTCSNKDLLIDELVDALRAHAEWRGMDLGGEPSVTITVDDGAASGLLEVSARVDTGAQLPPPVPTPAAPASVVVTDAADVDAVVADDAEADISEDPAPSEPDPVVEPVMNDVDVAAPVMPIPDQLETDDVSPDDAPLDAAAQLAALVAEEDHLANDDAVANDDDPMPPINPADDVRALLDTAPVDTISAIGALVADDGTRYPIGRTALRIGRMSDNDVVVHHAHVSRYHAEVRNDGGRAVLVDLGSTNGTMLNGRRTDTTAALTHGDKITLGDITLRFDSV